MEKVFLIPGLGADSRSYNNIIITGYEVKKVNWIEPVATDTLAIYAQRICKQYDITNGSILIGNSMGGMIAIEIAKQMKIKKVIQVSSIRTIAEEPGNFKLFRAIPLYKLVPAGLINKVGFMIRLLFRDLDKQDAWLFQDMLEKSSPTFMKWSFGAILNWGNTVIPPNVYQIIGDRDEIFPYIKQKEAEVIKGGTHLMIFDRADEVNQFIAKVLAL